MRKLLDHRDIDVNQQGSDGSSALHLACDQGHANVVQELLTAKNININMVSKTRKIIKFKLVFWLYKTWLYNFYFIYIHFICFCFLQP